MRIKIIPDKFKGTLTAVQVVDAIARGVRASCVRRGIVAEIEGYPLSDGGDGFVEIVRRTLGGVERVMSVCGPRGEQVEARWLDLGERAVVEMAQAAGLALVAPELRDPLETTTYGVGELMGAALNAKEVVVGIGGSATNDAGCGMCQALGVRFFADGHELPAPIFGGMVERIDRIDLSGLDPRVSGCKITVAADVTNPLTGPRGASKVFGPQKGLRDVEAMDRALARYGALVQAKIPSADPESAGSGAAGGLGFALRAILGGTIVPGFELMRRLLELDRAVGDADLVFTAEGQLDRSSLDGKICVAVARMGRPTVALVGQSTLGAEEAGFAGVYSIVGDLGVSVAEAMANGGELLAELAERAMDRALYELDHSR